MVLLGLELNAGASEMQKKRQCLDTLLVVGLELKRSSLLCSCFAALVFALLIAVGLLCLGAHSSGGPQKAGLL